MIQLPGTPVQFFVSGADTPVTATVVYATGDRSDPYAVGPGTAVVADLRLDALPAALTHAGYVLAAAFGGYDVYGIPRAASREAFEALDPEMCERGWWRPFALTEDEMRRAQDAVDAPGRDPRHAGAVAASVEAALRSGPGTPEWDRAAGLVAVDRERYSLSQGKGR